VWAARYRAWGNVLEVAQQDSPEVVSPDEIGEAQPVRFQGQYFDSETGLHYNRSRYYDPDIGRFVSIDPIGLSGGANTFAYSANPTASVDPLGLSPCKTSNANDANKIVSELRAEQIDCRAPLILVAGKPCFITLMRQECGELSVHKNCGFRQE
ncbi:RHS repeat-associated core domain-containing protein, partial [Massilia sp. CT11-108]|uniref:RHS repeat-associated core domain-containing protein n=1 Tax=Massilia sp. CT11-108 TaxID=3393900 RepID=UPI0039A4F5CA